ncbi:MAG: hypothetical protein KDK07_04540 [Bauldia sp.]|nr:hypothetical protein [Bauldia sp.]
MAEAHEIPAGEPADLADTDNRPRRQWLPAIMPGAARAAADDATVVDEWPAPQRFRPSHARSERESRRWLRGQAAGIALALALGVALGATIASGIDRMATRDEPPGAEEAVEALRASIGQLAFEIKALKDGVGEGSRVAASGLATVETRLAGAEQAQADLTARVTALSQSLTRPPPAVSPEITGSIARSGPPVAEDWVLWRVRNGRALVQGKRGYFEVAPGSSLPDLGLVQRIVKQNGRWVVLTRNGIIVARG